MDDKSPTQLVVGPNQPIGETQFRYQIQGRRLGRKKSLRTRLQEKITRLFRPDHSTQPAGAFQQSDLCFQSFAGGFPLQKISSGQT